MQITPGAPKPPIDELVTDSILIHLTGGYAVITQRAQAAGVQVGPALSYQVSDDKAQVLRVVDGEARVEERAAIKGVFAKLKDVAASTDVTAHVEAVLLDEGLVPGPKADVEDEKHEAAEAAVLADAEAVK